MGVEISGTGYALGIRGVLDTADSCLLTGVEYPALEYEGVNRLLGGVVEHSPTRVVRMLRGVAQVPSMCEMCDGLGCTFWGLDPLAILTMLL